MDATPATVGPRGSLANTGKIISNFDTGILTELMSNRNVVFAKSGYQVLYWRLVVFQSNKLLVKTCKKRSQANEENNSNC